MIREKEWVLMENEFAGYYGTRKIDPSEEICFIKDAQRVQLLFLMIILLQFSISPAYAEAPIPIPQTVVDRFREKTYLNHRYTRAETRAFLEQLHLPIIKQLKLELHELTKDALKKRYTQDAINQHILQKVIEEEVVKGAQKSILENDRNIKSLILTVSSQMDPFGRFRKPSHGNLPPFITLKDPLALRVNRLELALENAEERLANSEKLLLFQQDKIDVLQEEQETLISSIKLIGYGILIFQISKGTYLLFLSPYGREKIRKWKVVFFQKGEKICLSLLEKFKVQEH